MRYEEFEDAFSSDRMSKYVTACNGDTRRSMMLYRCNYAMQFCLAVCSILMHVLIRRAKLSTMLIENSSANIVTTIPNCSPKWSSAFGNTSTQMYTML